MMRVIDIKQRICLGRWNPVVKLALEATLALVDLSGCEHAVGPRQGTRSHSDLAFAEAWALFQPCGVGCVGPNSFTYAPWVWLAQGIYMKEEDRGNGANRNQRCKHHLGLMPTHRVHVCMYICLHHDKGLSHCIVLYHDKSRDTYATAFTK